MLRDILNQAIEYAEGPISDRKFLTYYNDAVHDLAMLYPTAKARQSRTIVCSDQTALYPLSAGCLGIERVLTSYGNYFSFYEVRGNSEIKFAVRDTYTIIELFKHAAATTMDAVVTINEAYIKAIAEYVAAKAIRKTDSDRSKELLANSAVDAEIANRNIRKANNPNKRVFAPRFR